MWSVIPVFYVIRTTTSCCIHCVAWLDYITFYASFVCLSVCLSFYLVHTYLRHGSTDNERKKGVIVQLGPTCLLALLIVTCSRVSETGCAGTIVLVVPAHYEYQIQLLLQACMHACMHATIKMMNVSFFRPANEISWLRRQQTETNAQPSS